MKYIGIDPDVHESGYSVWDSQLKTFDFIGQARFFTLTNLLLEMASNAEIIVVIEAGWMNKKSNYHGRPGQSKAVGETIAKRAGQNHQVAKFFAEFCQENNIKYTEIRPTQTKLNSKDFNKKTGHTGPSNQDYRDAAMLVYGM